jgi:hypothetical protein
MTVLPLSLTVCSVDSRDGNQTRWQQDLERLRDLIHRRLARGSQGWDSDRRISSLRERVSAIEHAVIDRMLRAEQAALARLHDPTAKPDRLFYDLPDQIARVCVLPFLAMGDLSAVARASAQGIGRLARAQLERLRHELEALSARYRWIRMCVRDAFARSGHLDPATVLDEACHEILEKLQVESRDYLQRGAFIRNLAQIYLSLSNQPPDALLDAIQNILVRKIAPSIHLIGDQQIPRFPVRLPGWTLAQDPLLCGRGRAVWEAVSQDALALPLSIPPLRSCEDLILRAVRWHAGAILFANPELRAREDFMVQAVRMNGMALYGASPDLRGNRRLAWEAARQTPDALQHVEGELRADIDFLTQVMRLDGRALQYVFPPTNGVPDLVRCAVQQEWTAIDFASDELQQDSAMQAWVAECRQQQEGSFFL